LDESALKRALVVFLDSATPADAQVREQVIRRLTERSLPAHRSRRGVLLVGIAAAVTLATVGTAFAASGNFPIRLNVIPFWSNTGPLKEKQPASASSANPPGKTAQASTTLSAAQASFGHHVLTPNASSGAVQKGVYFNPAEPVPAGSKPGQQATPASVSIEYSYAGTTATISQTFDPSSAPLTVDAVDHGGPQSKTSEGLGPIDIETVNGSPYAVVRTTINGPVQWLMWKTADGIVVTVEFDSPVPASIAFDLATHMG